MDQTSTPKNLSAFNNKALLRAAEHVSNNWFPVNPELLEKIKAKVIDGHEDDTHLILGEIKKDYALHILCLKRLKNMIEEEEGEDTSPIERLANADIETLKKILDVKKEDVSIHRFKEMSEIQASQLNFAMVSASTAEAFSEKTDIDPNTGYSCALLRQLGMTLISWNYPNVYKRALTSITPDASLDTILNKMLGFSPMLLGLQVAQDWELPAQVRFAMGDMSALNEEPDVQSDIVHTGAMLSKICKIGEALARINDPEHYPTSVSDMELVKNEVKRTLGSDGIALIKQKVLENCAAYIGTQPELFNITVVEEMDERVSTTGFALDLAARNTQLKYCPQIIQDLINKAYSRAIPNQVSKESIQILTIETMPKAGFPRGCIYLVDPVNVKLVPRLKIGDIDPRYLPSVSYYGASSSDYVVTAFRCNSLIKEENVNLNGRIVSYIAGPLGVYQKAGVLYLELSPQLQEKSNNALILFRAIKQAMNDCLGLG